MGTIQRVALGLACLAAAALGAAPGATAAEPAPSQRELNGYFLGQHKIVLEQVFGKPVDVQTHGIFTYHVVELPGEDPPYMVFSTHEQQPDYHIGIQITGTAAPDMRPFLGLRLGASREAVRKALGEPTGTKEMGTYFGRPEVVLWEYDTRNYNVMVDGEGRLLSIKLHSYHGFPDEPTNTGTYLEDFAAAVHSGETDRLVEVLMPDVEVFRGDDVLLLRAGLRAELDDPRSPIRAALLDGPRSVKAMLEVERPEPDAQLRIWEKGPGLGHVVKYPTSEIVQEIVFVQQAGKLRAWEVRLRAPEAAAEKAGSS